MPMVTRALGSKPVLKVAKVEIKLAEAKLGFKDGKLNTGIEVTQFYVPDSSSNGHLSK